MQDSEGLSRVKGTKFGVYIPEDLLRDLEACMKSMGIDSKSKVVQEALRLFITEHRWQTSGYAAGVIGVLYNHDVGHVDEELTDIQHRFLDIIISSLHIHLDRERCMLLIAVRGDTNRIKKLISAISSLRGVLLTRPLLLEAQFKRSHEHIHKHG